MSEYFGLVDRLRSSAKAFRENTVYDSDGDALRLTVQATECDQAADAIAKLEAERDRAFQHVAYFDDGKFEWMSGIRPRDCELYAHPLPTHTPAGN